ncbi:MAG: AAA family ATPase [Terrimicrobiaceae bacterium]
MIKFEKVRFKNFGSFGNNITEIVLDKNSTTLICGSNGSGKSFAFLDSITFALFGKPFRKINIPQLVNSVNEKGCLVEIDFSRGSDKFMVRRGINPRVFEIYKNGELIDQDAKSVDYQELLENQILKMNYKTFTQVVILGSSSFVPFMQLSAADRRSVIENILDINIFSTMNVVLKGKVLSLKETIKELNTKIEIEKNKINIQKSYIATLEKKNNEDDDVKNERIFELEKKIEIIKHDLISRNLSVEGLQADLNFIKKTLKEKNNKIQDARTHIVTLKNSKDQKQKEIHFFKENCTCPTCTQPIEDKLKKEKVLMNNYDISNLEDDIERVETHIKTLQEDCNRFDDNIQETTNRMQEVYSFNKEIEAYQKEIERIRNTMQRSVIKDNIIEEKEKLKGLEGGLAALDEEKTLHSNDLMYHELAGELLRDGGVKGKIIKYYLPHMNKFINKFLTSMDFFVQFQLDEEFNEQIKSRYRDDFSYMNFSEGEKMRIDLALLLAWREIARLKNSVSCNLLILDEVFDSSLDSVGMDELMKLLKTISDKANVYVISHKADQLVDKFSNIVSFEKKNNFSKIIYN